jgi:rod shape-determining protein MreC
MAIRDDFEVVALQVRVALQRFALVVLVVAAFVAMLIGKADTVLVENARVWALDLASPALEAIARPVAVANRAIADLKEFASLRQENARLREENSRLLAWQTAARRLENENERLRDLSQFREGPEASFITARIVGDSVSAYVRGALLNVGRRAGVTTGQGVVTGEGLAGRVAEVGDNSSRVLFVTDVNSRLPVLVERTRERAILAGDNSSLMRLLLLQGVAGVQKGDRIITSGDGGSFPVGIPVGEVVQTGAEGSVRVRPFADFSRLEFVRVVDYGVTGLVGSGSGQAGSGSGAPAGSTGSARGH